jgi:hypothetical protein
MQSVPITLNRYEFQTTINLRTGSITRTVDPNLSTAPDKTARLAEFDFRVTIDGLPLGEITNNVSDRLRTYVQDRLETLKPALLKQFEDEFHRIAARRLGERGWLVDRVEIEVGSFKFLAALYIGFELVSNYGALRTGVDYINQDLHTYAVPFAKQITRQVFDLEPAAVPIPPATVVQEPARPAAAAQAAPEESETIRRLKDIQDQIGDLRRQAGTPRAADQSLRDQISRLNPYGTEGLRTVNPPTPDQTPAAEGEPDAPQGPG